MPSPHPGGTTLRHGFASQGNAYTAYQFTSQRNETALGLYFYNARWYDPALSRFTSADTLVPGGVQGYDRYAYTSNNPVRYTDPSGHRCAPEDECEHPRGDRSTALPTGSVSLTPNGKRMQELLIAYQSIYGAEFSAFDLMILVLSGEFDPLYESPDYNNPELRDLLAHAATHWIYINQGEFSKNSILNWLTGMDSAWSRYNGWKANGTLGGYGRAKELAEYVADAMLNAPAEWRRKNPLTVEEGNTWNGTYLPLNHEPYTWGNKSLFTVNPTDYVTPLWEIPGTDPWYVLTLDQSNLLDQYRK